MSYSVYKHTFPNGKVYIGITSMKPERRWRNGSGYSANKQRLMNRAIQKYGWHNIKHEILFDGLTKKEAEQKEIELITKYKSNRIKFGYNVEKGGNSTGKISEETKKKIGIANKGREVSKETREKLSMASKGRTPWNKGKSSWNKGVPMTKESKKKLSKSLKGRYANENNPFYGKTHTEETKKKIRESRKGKQLSEETKEKISKTLGKKVMCIETDTIYLSIRDAERQTEINHCNISSCCNGKQKTAGGYHWVFVNEKSEED